MKEKFFKNRWGTVVAALLYVAGAGSAQAALQGVTGTTFTLTAKTGLVSTPDGGSLLAWGYANGSGPMQYPGVTMVVNQGDTITVNLRNTLPVPVSVVFPGQESVSAAGDADGVLTKEAAPLTGSAVYSFVARRPGTYLYHSGTRPEIQVEMGLLGALIVRPAGFDHMMPRAYEHIDTAYDREELFLLSEMDPRIHQTIEMEGVAALQNKDYLTNYFPQYWFINGRCSPDSMAAPGVGYLPNQPYNNMPMMHPGEKMLMRVIGGGRDEHPFHFHGNHARVIARNGRVLESAPGAGADVSYELFTIPSAPGETVDAVFQWTGKDLGWDMYGHAPGDPLQPGEWVPDHGKPFPVSIPDKLYSTFGPFYSGSPFLGAGAALPPGQGGLNPNAGYVYMWHSHSEKELTNFNIFPGGMMTMLIVEAPWVDLPHSH